MRLTEYFPRFLIVNLPERADRRHSIEQEWAKVQLQRIPQKVDFHPAIRPKETAGFPSIGAHGCFQSHLQILEQAKADQLEAILIGEDDLMLSPRYLLDEAKIVEQLQQQEWGFAYLGNAFNRIGTDPVQLQTWPEPILCTHFYAVHSRIFDRLINFLHQIKQRPPGHPDGGPMHLDGAYSTFRQQNPDILTLMALPTLGTQGSFASDILPSKWDRIPIVKPLVNLYRSAKRRVRGY